MSPREASTCSSPRTRARAGTLAILLLGGCAVGVDGTEDEPPLGATPDPAVLVDSGLAPLAPVLDAGPTFAPLPPNLSTPQEASVPLPPPRETGTATPRTPTGGGRTGSDAGSSTGILGGGGSRGGSTAGGSGTTTGCNPSRCANDCSLAGPIPCCTLLDTCGCTWAPGAYCL